MPHWLCAFSPVPPTVSVAFSQALEGMASLICWDFQFSPGNSSLTRLQDEEALSQDAQQLKGVLPGGNGTYWHGGGHRIPQGEEQRFTGYMEAIGSHTAHPVLA